MCARLSTVLPYRQDPTWHKNGKIELNNGTWYERKNAIELQNVSGHSHWLYKNQNFSAGVSLIWDGSKNQDERCKM